MSITTDFVQLIRAQPFPIVPSYNGSGFCGERGGINSRLGKERKREGEREGGREEELEVEFYKQNSRMRVCA